MLSLDQHPRRYPLISIKTSEMDECALDEWAGIAIWYGTFDLFLHDNPRGLCAHDTVRQARRVFAGSADIKRRIAEVRPDAVAGFCPSTLGGNPHRGQYRVLTFGMAHKRLSHHFSQLKHRLDTEHPDYTVEVSRVFHEGKPTNDRESISELRAIFGDKLRVLGFLSDDALAKELRDVDAVALYFDPALRANNTSAWAALDARKTLYTNTDEYSPPLDASAHSWETLLELIRG